MESAPRSELLKIIEYQKKENDKVGKKLLDLFSAYKGLIAEKEALEASLKALTNENTQTSNQSETENKTDLGRDAKTKDEDDRHLLSEKSDHLEKQLSTLTNSLATLSAEKSRMEACFQADKKQLKLEKEALEKKCQKLQEKVQNYGSEIEELKSKLASERHERDKEQNDHQLMVRELQQLVTSERSAKEKLEYKLEEVKLSSSEDSVQVDYFERQISDLTNELAVTTSQLQSSEKKFNETLFLLLQLQEEMSDLRNEHQIALQDEKERARDVEERSKDLLAMHEDRVANLEQRLTELSETVGAYERIRQQDQISIQRLKERITQLDADHAKHVNEELKCSEVDPNEEMELLVQKILELKKQLVIVNRKCEKPADLTSILNDDQATNEHSVDHSSCKEDYNKLKREYDLYRQQAPLLNMQEKSTKEVDTLKNQVKNLQGRLRLLSETAHESEKEYEREIDHLKKILKTEKERFKETLASSETDFRGRLCLLEQQLQKQRERSLALLEEKEQEIHSLQNTFQMFLPGYRNLQSTSDDAHKLNEDIVSKLNVIGSNSAKDRSHILHYANELARRDVEIANLRKNKHLVESTLRDLQKAAISDNEKHMYERQNLREEIARLERCKSREGANLEYLKNVVYSFLISSDANSKRHMLNAIAAVLKFSENEIEKVTKHSSNSWWVRTNLKT